MGMALRANERKERRKKGGRNEKKAIRKEGGRETIVPKVHLDLTI